MDTKDNSGINKTQSEREIKLEKAIEKYKMRIKQSLKKQNLDLKKIQN